ncbi:hypothetical protein [Halalkalibacter nanhaiisediminis]|uniref:Spore coat protein CotO n=1 Tax=Halalkalibacter nanhaiisediminis TaxID=688079 RepID=A0A562Q938_9BACI|nr:hypothetical protein [Halalkalibacter nanhaiisediminis]TWI53277.1 hypothetical protein IQ10_03411 [Halalkalibacter nanhaiisediminis]
MPKRTLPLLYIHQAKETEVEVDNQEFFYRKKELDKEVQQEIVGRREETKSDTSREARDQVQKDKVKVWETKVAKVNLVNKQIDVEERSISEKITYIQSMPDTIKPNTELQVKGMTYIGLIEKIENEKIMLRMEAPPHNIELNLNEVTAIKVVNP